MCAGYFQQHAAYLNNNNDDDNDNDDNDDDDDDNNNNNNNNNKQGFYQLLDRVPEANGYLLALRRQLSGSGDRLFELITRNGQAEAPLQARDQRTRGLFRFRQQ